MTRPSPPLPLAVAHLCEAIDAHDPYTPSNDPWSEATFSALAMPLFARQVAENAALRALCERRGLDPGAMTSWREIPAIPTDAFKHLRMSCASPEQTVRTFLTSGTSQGARGAHHFGTLDAYASALLKPFARYALPDRATLRYLVLAPADEDLLESSLSFMLSKLVARYGTHDSQFFIARDPVTGALSFDLVGLTRALDAAQRSGEPVMILSTAFALMQLFDAHPRRIWRLPEGSRLMETGGFKGRSREVSREELYALFTQRLGLPATHCISEYSMTELSTQAYTHTLYAAHHQIPTNLDGPRYEVPPWVRIQIVDPLTLSPDVSQGDVGLVRWVDLANVESSLVIQTSDRGRLDACGRLELLGRAPESELRGCSLTIEELIDSQQDASS